MSLLPRTKFTLVLLIFTIICVAATEAVCQEYRIQPNDQIRVSVYDNPDLNVDALVPPDGLISFPMAGEINVLDRTPEELATLLKEKLSYYIKDPDINVYVQPETPLKVYVLGAVRKPGPVNYKPGSRLTDYITEAGGYTELANLDKLYIYPQSDSLPRIHINLEDVLKEGEMEQNIELRPFDTIFLQESSGFAFLTWRDVGEFLRIITGIMTMYIFFDRL